MSYTPISRVGGRDGRAGGVCEVVCQGAGSNSHFWGSACVSKAMFHLISGSPPGRRLTATHNIVVPDASFICQEVNLSEIESENNAQSVESDIVYDSQSKEKNSNLSCICA